MKNHNYLPCLFLLGLGAFVSTTLAQTPGTFTATGNMTTSRSRHSATLLADGRVLIAGGQTIEYGPFLIRTLSSAELYDPHTGTFTATGNMTKPRAGHAAYLLPDGKVLILGAGKAGDVTAELYDPDTGTFSATGNMTTAVARGSSALLNNGKILIAGSNGANAELYDPTTGTFSATGIMTAGGAQTATLLADGRVLLTRNPLDGPPYPPPFLAELYDPKTGTFAGTANTSGNFFGPTANLLMNGTVLIAGGDTGQGDGFWGAVRYDPITDTFTGTGSMTTGREQHAAILLPDGTVLFAGGYRSDLAASAEIYDPGTGIFTATGHIVADRADATATLLPNGTVLMTGGEWGEYVLAGAELYTPSVLVPAPVLLSLSGDGKGQGAIQHANTVRIASATDPAVAGEYLSIYLTGLTDGGLIPPQVVIGGRLAEVTFFGNVPGYKGLNVINARMPAGVAPGPAIPVRLTYLGRSSNQVTIGVSPSTFVNSVVNAASILAGAIAPGELVAITGLGLGPDKLVSAAPSGDGLYPTELAGTTVLIDGIRATLIYTWATQVAAVVPDSVSGGTAHVTVIYQGKTSASFPVPVAPTAPGIFTQDATGQGHAAAINQNGLINVAAHWEGDLMTLFLTGSGHTTPPIATYLNQQLPITPGAVPGVMQIKVPIPHGTDCDVPIVVQVGDASSQPGVTIAIDTCI